jgi:hypothetical protein
MLLLGKVIESLLISSSISSIRSLSVSPNLSVAPAILDFALSPFLFTDKSFYALYYFKKLEVFYSSLSSFLF